MSEKNPTAGMPWDGKTVCLDFDGVLHSYASGWTGPVPLDPPNDGAQRFVLDILLMGAKVVILSSRASDRVGREGIEQWLAMHSFPLFNVTVTGMKPPAVAYVDDRGVTYDDGNWGECLAGIERMVRK